MCTTLPEQTATVDVLTADDRTRILKHMNEDHADAVLHYARHFGGRRNAVSAVLRGIDARGIELEVTEPEGSRLLNIAFDKPLQTASDAHATLVRMARTAASEPSSSNEQRRIQAVEFLRAHVQTLALSTVSAAGVPDASVAPFVTGPDGHLYIFVSDLSTHTANLRATGRAGALLVEDESTAGHRMARRRIALVCTGEEVPRSEAVAEDVLSRLRERFGPVMSHLQGMKDFHLFRLRATSARLVAGFGQAYDLQPDDWTQARHINDRGHTPGHAPVAAHAPAS